MLSLLSSPAAASNDERCTILVLGDSLSAAYGMSTKEGWVALMNGRLKQQGYDCRVINASVSGDTTQGGRARLPSLLKRHQPTHLILELGANNGLRALSADMMEKDLAWMIQAARSAGSCVLLVGMQMPPNYGPVYRAQFAAVYERLAEKEQVPFVPFLLEGVIDHPEWMQADALHPKAKAQLRLLENIWPALLSLQPVKSH